MTESKTTPSISPYIVIIPVLLGIVMTALDGTIMNVALPTLVDKFRITPGYGVWIVNAYQLTITVSILGFAALGNIIGYKNLFLGGIIVFTISSGICALSDSFMAVVIIRVIQGFGASAVMSVNPALVRLIYPSSMLGRGLALNAMIIAIAAASGPSVGGLILKITTWHWLFLINVPIGIATFILGKRLLNQSVNIKHKMKYDFIGAITTALTLGLFIFAVDGVAHSESVWISITEISLCIIIGWFMVKRESKRTNPLFPVDLLKIKSFSLALGTSASSFATQMLALVSLPFYLQNDLGFNTFMVGVLLTAWPLTSLISAPLAGRLVEKYPAGLIASFGMGILAIGLISIILLPPNPSEFDIILRLALCGFGFGFFQTPNNVAIITSAPKERNSGASGMLGLARLLGQTFGTSLVAFFFHTFPMDKHAFTCLSMATIFALISIIISASRLYHKFAKT